ncbi:hypothetical protein WJX82_002006 [Trebouxia sp. C0006]
MENGVGQHQAPRRYLSYLPQDNSGLADPQSEQVVQTISNDLAELLSSPIAEFWHSVATADSLIACLDSYLRFARRPFDEPQGFPSDAHLQLSRRVFATFSRLITTAGTSARSQNAQILYDRWVLDVPKLLDLAAIYGPDNAKLLQQLLQQVFKVQPLYARDVWDTGPTLTSNLQDVLQTCQQASDGLKQDGRNTRLLTGLSDGVQYMRDLCMTLCYFLQAYPSGAQLLLQGQASMVTQLTSLHDDLVPQMARAVTSASQHSQLQAAQVLHHLRHLIPASQKLTHLLVSQACLQASPVPQLTRPPWGGGQAFSPAAKGELLMAAVMAMAQPSQHTQGSATLLNALLSSFGLAAAAQSAIAKGTVQMDIDQQDYLGVLLGDPSSFGSEAGSSALAAAPAGQQSQQALQTYIGQIKEVMPNFGDGFLAAALQHFSYNSERVIHTLLEGDLPPELKGLDPQMPLPAAGTTGRGVAQPSSNGKTAASEAKWSDLAVAAAAADKPSSGSANPSLTAQQAARRSAHKATSKMLDARSEAEKAAQLQFADAAQWEYEDEYDDSYDDLAPFGNDGIADAEGDDEGGTAHPGPFTWPGGAKPPGFPTPGRPPAGQQQQQKGSKPSKQWVLDGRIYNYKKEGAVEVRSQAEAQQAVQAAADAVHGLGRGGNVPQALPQAAHAGAPGEGDEAQGTSRDPQAATRGRGGGQRGGAQRGASNNVQRDHRHKDMHKAAVANHHRKDRALRKQGGPAV